SGKSGGDLGEFSPGQMVKEFDQVVFSDEVGKVHGPVKTDFGYHLIEITDRTE
ncbi:MAG: peptidylprolyl isomerase, partial [Candidatus Scalindua sp.]